MTKGIVYFFVGMDALSDNNEKPKNTWNQFIYSRIEQLVRATDGFLMGHKYTSHLLLSKQIKPFMI